MLSVAGCARDMALSDMCLHIDKADIQTENEAIAYDCLCHPEPIIEVCK